jgi:hypothetical protein
VQHIDLRSYVFLDSLQPQYAAFLGTIAQGFLPLAGDASLWVEISPGIEINRLTDVALKATHVRPGMQIVERYYGLLEVHSESQADTRAAGAAILEEIGLKETDRRKPKILSSQVIRRLDDHQVQLINRMRHGHMIIPGQTMYVLEVEPAAYAALAANEAEKAADINIDGPGLPRRRGAGYRRRLAGGGRRHRGRRGTGREGKMNSEFGIDALNRERSI